MSKNFLVLGYGFKIKPLATAPTPAADGDVYYDSTLSTFRIRENGAWNDIGGTTLQQAYDAEAAGSTVELTVSSTNGPLVISGDSEAPLQVKKALRLSSTGSGHIDLTLGSSVASYSLTIPSAAPSEDSFPVVSASGIVSWSPAVPPSYPQNTQTSSYTLTASDAGKHISITSGGVTIPPSVFSLGDVTLVYNNSSSSQALTQGSDVTLRLAGTSTTGNLSLSQYGLCSLLCVTEGSNPTFVAYGNGLS